LQERVLKKIKREKRGWIWKRRKWESQRMLTFSEFGIVIMKVWARKKKFLIHLLTLFLVTV
jgi:hypothetical protein